MDDNEQLLEFFKALSDANRLKIIGLLAERPLTVEQMAEMLHLRASTVSNHLRASRFTSAVCPSSREMPKESK